jgi:hypothetical protein
MASVKFLNSITERAGSEQQAAPSPAPKHKNAP